MSELIAEARVLVTPDTTSFRALLTTQLAAVTKGVTVPVSVTPVAGAATSAAVTKQVAGAQSASALFAREQEKLLAQRVTAETAAADKRIAQNQKTVLALLAEERDLAVQQEKFAAQRVTDETEVSARRIASREKEVAGLLAQEKQLAVQEARLSAERVTAETAASSRRIAAREREIAALLAADKTAQASSLRTVESQAAAAAAAQARALGGVSKGASSAAASLVGVRGATLAATGPFLAGAAGAIALGKALSIATGFNQQLSVFAATTGATADEMDRVSESAQQLGKDLTLPGVSASDAAESMTEFAKAGLSVNDAIVATRGGLQLATAAQLSNAEAVEITASALNAFKLSGDKAVSVADTLANAANLAQGSIADIALGLKQSSGAAAAVGVSFRDTTALLTLLAKNGLTASDAGTALRTAFIRLVNPSKQAREILSDLNVNLRDAQGNLRPQVFQEFAAAQQNLARSTQQANSAIVFGQDAFRVIGLLGREPVDALTNVQKGLDETGTAAKIAGARMTGVAGAAANLKNQLEGLGLTLGAVFSGPAQGFLEGAANLVDSINKVSAKIGDFVKPTTIDDTSASLGTLIDRVQGLQQAASFAPDPKFAQALIDGAAQVEKALEAEGKRLVQQGFLTRFIDEFSARSPDVKKAMEDNIITPAEEAQLQASGIGRAFLAALPHTAEFFQSFGITAKSAIEEAATAIRDPSAVAAALRSNIEDAGAAAKAGAAAAGAAHGKVIVDSIAAAIAAGKQAIADALKNLPSASSVLSRDIAVAQAGGNQNQELALLRQREANQQEFLDAVLKRPQTDKNVQLAEDAARNLEATRNAIQGIMDKRASVAQQAASAAEATANAEKDAAARVKAANDQTFLQRQEDARTAQERLVTRAQDTTGLTDDINRQQQLRALIVRQIAAIKTSALDEEAKADALRTLKKARDATTDEINRLVATDKAQRAAQRQQNQEALASARLELAQTTFDLTGAKAPLERALDAEIKRQIKIKNAAKKGSVEFLNAQNEIRKLLKQKNDLNEELKKDAGDTGGGLTAFDILKQNAETFNATGGNLVTGNQPFAGPTGFTADVAQFLHRPPQVEMVMKKADFTAPLVSSNAELIRVIQDNTEAIRESNGTGNDSSAGTGFSGAGKWWARSFYTSRVARQLTEAENP